jgi:hypothetical protein
LTASGKRNIIRKEKDDMSSSFKYTNKYTLQKPINKEMYEQAEAQSLQIYDTAGRKKELKCIMKIIQMQNRELIQLSLRVILAMGIIFAIILIIALTLSQSDSKQEPYQSAEEMLVIFQTNQADFEKVTEILIDNEVLENLLEDYLFGKKKTYPTGDSLSEPRKQLKNKSFVSKEDYEYLCSFFDIYMPLGIDSVSCQAIEFYFTSHANRLDMFYIYDMSDRLLSYIEQNGKISHLNGNWYYRIDAW